jgi:hypothetical protein
VSHQDEIIAAFRATLKDRLSVDQLIQITGLKRDQITSAAYQLRIKDIGFTEAIVHGKPRKGVYAYAEPGATAPVSPAAPIAEPKRDTNFMVLRIVHTLPEGWSIGVEESTGKAYRVEKM